MLSLSPRWDLFRFMLPKEFFPERIRDKYQKVINKNASVIMDPVSYVNESITGATLPGISELNYTQPQTSRNKAKQIGLGKLNIEPAHDNFYQTPANPLQNIDKEFKVTFRQNQGLLNYFMIYESVLERLIKGNELEPVGVFTLDILSEIGVPTAKIHLYQPLVTGIDGLEFMYSKIDRSSETFDVTFNYNNIGFEFAEDL